MDMRDRNCYMIVVLLTRGIGPQISEKSVFKPKPMIEIGGMLILRYPDRFDTSYDVLQIAEAHDDPYEEFDASATRNNSAHLN